MQLASGEPLLAPLLVGERGVQPIDRHGHLSRRGKRETVQTLAGCSEPFGEFIAEGDRLGCPTQRLDSQLVGDAAATS